MGFNNILSLEPQSPQLIKKKTENQSFKNCEDKGVFQENIP